MIWTRNSQELTHIKVLTYMQMDKIGKGEAMAENQNKRILG